MPFRLYAPFEGVIPIHNSLVLDSTTAANPERGFDQLSGWLKAAEATWDQLKSESTKLTWSEQQNYNGKLASQFPIAPLRIVYAKSGTQPAACIIRDDRAVIDHMLYWAATVSENEATYLTAILNSEAARSRAAHFQARGQFGARHFDKVMFNLPIPVFDPAVPLHRDLADLGATAETVAALVEIPEGERFVAARQRVRRALIDEGVAGSIEKLVEKLLDAAAGD